MSDTLFSISFDELCQLDGVESHLVIEIVEYGIVIPLNKNIESTGYEHWLFDTTGVYLIKKALRLHHDLEIDWIVIAILLKLMQQKEALHKENEAYKRQLNRFIKDDAN